MRALRIALPLVAALSLVIVTSTTAFAATSGSFVFDEAGDAGDNADGPQYDITLVGAQDDGFTCDAVVMVMVDPTGAVLDVDQNCIDTTTGTGSDDGDYGTVEAGPASNPVTYALFDLDPADVTALSALTEGSAEYVTYVLDNTTCLDQQFRTETELAIPIAEAFLLCDIEPPVADAPTTADPGGTITVTGSGCPAGTVTAELVSEDLTTLLASGTDTVTGLDDAFSIDLVVPADAGGELTVQVFCGTAEVPTSGATVLGVSVAAPVVTPTTTAPPAAAAVVTPAFTG